MADTFIYFAYTISPGRGVMIKVGFSKNPTRRAHHLLSELIVSVPGGPDEEKIIHTILGAHHLLHEDPLLNEWFKPCRRVHRMMLDCIETGRLPDHIIDAARLYRAARIAKAEASRAAGLAAAYYGDGPHSKIGWADTAFRNSNKKPDLHDDSWIPQRARARRMMLERKL